MTAKRNTMAGFPSFDEQGHHRLMAVTQQEIENRLWTPLCGDRARPQV
jgi:hypothetical protein